MSDPSMELLTGLMDGFDQLREACVAHREMMLGAGFSEIAAEMMTVQFHAALIAKSLR